MMFRRKIYDKLLEWKNDASGEKALLIEGARRIGKSTIAEEFGKNEYKSYVLIDFNNVSKGIIEAFDHLNNLDLLDFDTSNVLDFSYMFSGCRTFDYIDVSRFKTNNAENLSNMFSNCNNLIGLKHQISKQVK